MGRAARVHKTASRISGSARFHDVLSVLQIPVGPFQANAYLAWDRAPDPHERVPRAFLVDAGAEADRLLSELEARKLSLAAILQTHAHGDHIAALDDVVAATGAPVYLHPDAEPMLRSPEINLSLFAGMPVRSAVAYRPVREGEELTLLDRAVRVYETPGHAMGSVCYHFPDDGLVFTGDALFAGSIGRTDFPGGSFETLVGRIRDKLLTLPDETIVYPGHLEPTTIGRERRSNPFLQGGADDR
jgi:glyoxylase-like metal-dependent hydrolase (beta-lactamase superfamily II)